MVELREDGGHVTAAGPVPEIASRFEDLAGQEWVIRDGAGVFTAKLIPSPPGDDH